jgi:hypothetical protein
MLTVKEFKDLGGEFVIGDNGFGFYVAREEFINGIKEFDDHVVNSFAWRTNTGVKPKFNGVIEVKLRSGRVVSPGEIINQGGRVVWDLDGDQCDIVEWRPLLEQPKKSAYDVDAHVSVARPVFTQEFAIRGGSSIPFVWEPCAVKYRGSKYTVLVDGNGHEHSRKKAKLMIRDIDNRTPKQKAVELMFAAAINSKDDIMKAVIYDVCEKLYDAGYTDGSIFADDYEEC